MKQVTRTLIVLWLALSASLGAQHPTPMEDDLARAIRTETADGDLPGAIRQYKEIAARHASNRTVAATALARLARCYQKLGDPEAAVVASTVRRTYPDQPDALAIVRTVAGGRESVAPEFTIRRLETTGMEAESVTDDGARVALTDWATGDIVVRDVGSGRVVNVTAQKLGPNGRYSEFGETPLLSSDGRQIAYTWCTTEGNNCSGYLRVSPAEPSATPKVLYGKDDWTIPYDWSPDGSLLAVSIARRGTRLHDVAVINVATGDLKQLTTLEPGLRPVRMFFSPDGRHVAFDTGRRTPIGGPVTRRTDIFVVPVTGGPARKVAVPPAYCLVAGWAANDRLIFTSDTDGSVDLYTVAVDDGAPHGRVELLKAGLGEITPVRVTRSGAFYYSVESGGERRIGQTVMDFRAGRFARPATFPERGVGHSTHPQWSPDGKWLAYIYRRSSTPRARASIMLQAADGGDQRELRPDLTQIGPLHWDRSGAAIYTLGTAGNDIAGLYRVDTRSGGIEVVAQGEQLTHLIVDGQRALAYLFRSEQQRHRFISVDLEQRQERELFAYEARGNTSPASISPDGTRVYYRRPVAGAHGPATAITVVERTLATGVERELYSGRVPFIVLAPDGRHVGMRRIDSDGQGSAISIIDTSGVPAIRDLIRMDGTGVLALARWSPDGASVLVNKPGEEPRQTWWVPIDGSAPKQLPEFMGNVSIHPDGSRIAFQVGDQQNRRFETWVMERFLPSPKKPRP